MISESGLWWFVRIATIISLNVNIRRYVCHSIGIRDLIIFNYIKKGGIMKKIVLKLYEFDELPKDSQEKIIERERWNVMEQCMDAYDIDYKKSMEAFEG